MPTPAQYRSYLQLPHVRGSGHDRVGGGAQLQHAFWRRHLLRQPAPQSTDNRRRLHLDRSGPLPVPLPDVDRDQGPARPAGLLPRQQNIAALDLINQRGELTKLINGDFEGMMKGLGRAWAALGPHFHIQPAVKKQSPSRRRWNTSKTL